MKEMKNNKKRSGYAIIYPNVAAYCAEHNKQVELVDCLAKLNDSLNDMEEIENGTLFIDTVNKVVFTIKVSIKEKDYVCEIYNISL